VISTHAFIRSDQYSFIKEGVPSLAMKVGFEPNTPEAALFKQWLNERNHAPSDNANQPVDLTAAAGFEEVMRGLTFKSPMIRARRRGRTIAFSGGSRRRSIERMGARHPRRVGIWGSGSIFNRR
jgi:hypothetical protein